MQNVLLVKFRVYGLPKPGGSKTGFYNKKLKRVMLVDASDNKDWRNNVRFSALEAYAGKPMTREEAALQLEGTRQAFLVFEEAETGQLAVLARRKDGDFKLILQE